MKETINNNRPLYNSRNLNAWLKLLKKKYSYINIQEILDYAKMEAHEVEDEGHWFTQEQIDLFYEKIEELTKNKNIAREAGRYAASPDAIGIMRPYILGLIGPANAYELVEKYASHFVRSSIYESKRTGPNKVEISVTPKDGVTERPYQCENRIGYWQAISAIFNYKLPKIEHPECMFRGENVCRYIVTWRETRSNQWKKIRNYSALVLSLIVFLTVLNYPDITPLVIFASFLAVLSLTIYAERLEKKDLLAAIDNLKDNSDKLIEQIDSKYNNTLLINEIGKAISKQMSVDSILSNVVQVLEKRLDYDRGLILLANEDKTALYFRNGFGYTFEQFNILKNTTFHLDRQESRGVFVLSFKNQKPFLINDIEEIKGTLSEHSLEFAKKMGARSFICCPVVYGQESLGIIAVDNLKTKKPLVQSDINLLMGIAPEIGISIHNAQLLEARERQFKSIIATLAASIDARDFLTAGHSEKVAEYAVGICREMGMPEDFTEMTRVAALLHDYGKIGIEDHILKKNGSLTAVEHEIIRSHAEKTRDILQQINFEGIYKEIPEIAGCHHEKIDGSGYPRGLKENEIPLGARIIAVADFFDSITSKRHYREPMPVNEALELMKTKSGIHFDSRIIDAFICYYNTRYNHYQQAAGFLSNNRKLFMTDA